MSGSWPDHTLPHLNPTNHRVTSPRKSRYNCIAWAAGSEDEWWSPVQRYYWPADVPREQTVEAFEKAFVTLGYEECADGSLEEGWEKIAIFAKNTGDTARLLPTHVARQLQDGRWTSKLGTLEDIERKRSA